ncbi:hypothetical protein [Arcanobacterium hippocoleae]|uniref:hypothetical protein n=1 Tax=Arcanobacterium hippocoleae TaxID=149017 RepID=UPI00333ED040
MTQAVHGKEEGNLTQDNPHYGRITSFSLRGSRLGDKYEKLMQERGSEFTLQVPAGFAHATIAPGTRIDLQEVFGRNAPIVVEVGPGFGEQLMHGARMHPEWNFLAFEAWAPGVARCVHHAIQADVQNVRIAQLDAAQALPIVFGSPLAPAALQTAANDPEKAGEPQFAAEVWTFFPDPWRKKNTASGGLFHQHLRR